MSRTSWYKNKYKHGPLVLLVWVQSTQTTLTANRVSILHTLVWIRFFKIINFDRQEKMGSWDELPPELCQYIMRHRALLTHELAMVAIRTWGVERQGNYIFTTKVHWCKWACREYGLPVSGRRWELTRRIRNHKTQLVQESFHSGRFWQAVEANQTPHVTC